jgi:hypothetical protein
MLAAINELIADRLDQKNRSDLIHELIADALEGRKEGPLNQSAPPQLSPTFACEFWYSAQSRSP